MKKIVFFTISFFFSQILFAQEQITNFENLTDQSPKDIKYVGQVNDKVLFTAWTAEASSSNVMWTSDGTPQNTYPLTKNGYDYTYFSSNYQQHCYGYFYYSSGRTDGSKFEELSKTLYNLFKIDNKLYSIHNDTLSYLDSLNRFITLDTQIISYKERNGNLFYSKIDSSSQNYVIYNLKDRNIEEVLRVPFEPISQYSNYYSLSDFYVNGNYQYFFVSNGIKIILIQKNTLNNNFDILNWGESRYTGDYRQDFLLSDNINDRYFIKYPKDSIEIYKPTLEGGLKTILKDSLSRLMFTFPSYYGVGKISSMKINGDIFILSTFIDGEGGVYDLRINEYDLKTKKRRSSINLRPWIKTYWDSWQINLVKNEYVVENEYYIDEGLGTKYLYSFKENAVIDTVQYKDSTTTTISRNKKFLFYDNVYVLDTNNFTTPLIKQESFATKSYDAPIYKIINNKIFFWKYNKVLKKQQLFISDGTSKTTHLLKTFDESQGFYVTGIEEFDGKIYFGIIKFEESITLFYTDIISGETKNLYNTMGNFSGIHSNKNTNYIVYQIYENGWHNTLVIDKKTNEQPYILERTLSDIKIITTKENLYYIKTIEAMSMYMTIYSYNIYIFKNNKLELVDDKIKEYLIANDKLIYIKESSKGYIIMADGSIIPFKNNDNSYGFEIQSNYLISKRNEKESQNIVYISFFNIKTYKDFSYKFVNENSSDNYTIPIIVGEDIVIFGRKKMVILKDEKEIVLPITSAPTTSFKYKNGIIFVTQSEQGTQKELNYYDNSNNKIVEIYRYNDNYITFLANDNSDYLLFSPYENSLSNKWKYWIPKTNEVKNIAINTYFYNLENNVALSQTHGNYTQFYLWTLQDNTVIEKHNINNCATYPIPIENRWIYLQKSTKKGNELIGVTTDSTTVYPEIVEGKRGIDELRDVFLFNNNLYISAFTYTHGWQVWNMGKLQVKEVSDNPLSQEEKESSVLVFPNPASNYLEVSNSKNLQYQLINLQGQLQLQGKIINDEKIDVSALPQGVYLLMLSDGNQRVVKKIIKL